MITLIMFNGAFAFAEETPCSPGQPCLEKIQHLEPSEPQLASCLSEKQPCFSQINQPKRQPKTTCFPGQICTSTERSRDDRNKGNTAPFAPQPPKRLSIQ